eukprot:131628_1
MGLIDSAGQINQDILAGTMIVVGLFVTFFGARFFKHIIFFVGFIIGGFLTYYSVPIIFSWFDSKVADDTLLYMSLTVGALCGVLLVVVYKAAVFSCGAICGAIFSQILWIAVVANIDTEGKDWLVGVQIGALVVFALLGGYLAFKFVEQVLKAITAFVGGFMFASGIAFFIARIEDNGKKNVIDWVVFFGSYKNYNNLENACDVYCIVCILIWLILFASGCFVQYKLHKKHKRKDHDDENDSDSEYSDSEDGRHKKHRDSDSDSSESESDSRRSKRRKKKREKDKVDNESYHGGKNEYDEPQYAGSQYGGSVRQSGRFGGGGSPLYAQSEGVLGGPGSSKNNNGPMIAMSEYGKGYHNGNNQLQQQQQGGYAHSQQYGDYGQRNQVQYV